MNYILYYIVLRCRVILEVYVYWFNHSCMTIVYQLVCFQCNRTRAMKLYNREVIDHPNMVAVIGCGCSSATEQVALASNGSIPVVSEIYLGVH